MLRTLEKVGMGQVASGDGMQRVGGTWWVGGIAWVGWWGVGAQLLVDSSQLFVFLLQGNPGYDL